MIIHIAANRQWAEVMSIPRDSYVSIPACKMGNGQMSAAQTFKINEAFALGDLDGNNTALGVAYKMRLSAVGGVQKSTPQHINDPLSGLKLTAGQHLLTPKQALAYVRARYTLGDGSDLDRIAGAQAVMCSLVQGV